MGESGAAILLRAGLISREQLTSALAMRKQQGGTVGLHLIQMGALQEEQLAEFYRHRLMVPRIVRPQLERVVPSVVARLPADMALEFHVIPVETDAEGNLTLAMADPADTHAVDEIGFFTGHYVMRAVATESDIAWGLSRFYGHAAAASPAATPIVVPTLAPAVAPVIQATPQAPEPSPASAPVLLTKVKGTPAPTVVPPLPQATPEPVILDRPKPKRSRPPREGTKPPLTKSGNGQASSRRQTRPAGSGEHKPAAPPTTAAPSAPPAAQPAPPAPPAPAAPAAPATTLDASIRALRSAKDRDSIVKIPLDLLATLFSRSAFFLVKKDQITCWDSRGVAQTTALSALVIPMAAPSLLRDVATDGNLYRGPLPKGPIDDLLALALGQVTGDIVLAPIRIRGRLIGLLYADTPKGPAPDGLFGRLSFEISSAYERLLREGKA